MNRKNKNGRTEDRGTDAIELAILNGLEAYNREQAQKSRRNGKPAPEQGAERKTEQRAPQGKKNLGEERSAEAMREAGFKPRRRSSAKGKGTKIVTADHAALGRESEPKKSAPVQEGQPRGQKGQKERGKKKKPVKVLFFGGVGEIGKNMTAIEYGNDIVIIDAGIIFPTEEMPGIDLVFPDITYLVQNKHKVRGVFLKIGRASCRDRV